MSQYPRYTMVIRWSDDEDAYLVSLPDWEGRVSNPVTHGNSYEDAVRAGVEAITAFVESSIRHGEPLPSPGRTNEGMSAA